MVTLPLKTLHKILADELLKKNVFSMWVLHLLTPEQKRVPSGGRVYRGLLVGIVEKLALFTVSCPM